LKNRSGELEEGRKKMVQKVTRKGNKETEKTEDKDVGYK
jgi:hypothetical protein